MTKNPLRALSLGIAAARRLSTAPALMAAPTAAKTEAEAGAVPPTTWKPLYRRLSAVGGGTGGTVAKTMDGWMREGRVVTELELLKYVRELRKYARHKHALDLLDWMEKRGMKFSVKNHAIRLDLLSKVEGIDSAESYFSGLPDKAKNRQTYGALFSCYCQEKLADKAIALFEKMRELNFASNNLVHNNLMTLYMKLSEPEKVQALYGEMKANNLSPDKYTYCILMNSYASQNDIGSVERVVQEMKEQGLTLDWTIYSILASHYISSGLFQKADYALKQCERVMNKMSREPFMHLISLYAGIGDLSEVNRVWKSLKDAFSKITNMNYLVMLQALNNLDDLEAVKQCFEEWYNDSAIYDIRLANVMIGAYLKKNMIREAESVREKALQKGVQSDLRTFELFIGYYLNKLDIDSALKWFEDATNNLEQVGWKPDKDLVNGFLKYFKEASDVNGIELFVKNLKKLICINAEAYEALINTYSTAGKKDPLLRQRIKEDGIEISPESKKLLEMICKVD